MDAYNINYLWAAGRDAEPLLISPGDIASGNATGASRLSGGSTVATEGALASETGLESGSVTSVANGAKLGGGRLLRVLSKNASGHGNE